MTRISRIEIAYIAFMGFCVGICVGAEVARRLV